MDLRGKVEATLMVSSIPLSVEKIAGIVESDSESVGRAIQELRTEFETSNHSFSIVDIAGGVQILTKPDYADIIAKVIKIRQEKKLSRAALETLSIIAYKQPVKRQEIEAIRGSNPADIIKALLEYGLVRIVGRDKAPGNPLLYGTTEKFLRIFGISAVNDLPRLEELK